MRLEIETDSGALRLDAGCCRFWVNADDQVIEHIENVAEDADLEVV
jgi:hypothetical protein